MTQINQNIHNNIEAQPRFKSADALPLQQTPVVIPEVQLPDLYYNPNLKEKKTFKESLKKVDMFGLVYPWLETPFLMAGSCAGLAFGVDKFAQACGGEYKSSILGKAANLGDSIEQSKFIQSNPVQKFFGWIKGGTKKVKHIFRNSDIVKSLKTPSMPENPIPLSEMQTQEHRVAEEFFRITDGLRLDSQDAIKVTDIGINKKEQEALKKLFKVSDLTKVNETKLVNTALLKRLGKTEAEIRNILVFGDDVATAMVKDEILAKLGLTAQELKEIKLDPEKYISKIKAAAQKGRKNVWVGAGEYNWMNKWLKGFQPFKRYIGCDDIYNRYHSMGEGAKTKTGQFFSKALQTLHRGFTFGGGKLGVLLFVSPIVVDTIKHTKEADPDRKIGTAAHGIIEAVSWVITFPLALKIMHGLGGMQYAGMSPEKVKEYRKLLNDFNAKVKNKAFRNKDQYKAARKTLKAQLKKLKTVKGQNLLTKTLRKIGSFITVGLEVPLGYQNNNTFMNIVRKGNKFSKNLLGVPLRIGVWALIAMGLLGTTITKCTNAIFGKHHDAFKEEEHVENKKKQKEYTKQDLQNRLLELQKQKTMIGSSPVEDIDSNNIENNPNTITPSNPIVEETTENIVQENNPSGKLKQNPEEVLAKLRIAQEEAQIKSQLENIEKEEAVVNKPTVEETVAEEPVAEAPIIKEKPPEQKPAQNIPETPVAQEQYSQIHKSIEPQGKDKYIPNQNCEIKIPNNKRDNYTYMPSQENVLKQQADENAHNKYIPSQTSSNFIKTFDNSGLEAALRRADRAEQQAIDVLNGKFDSI